MKINDMDDQVEFFSMAVQDAASRSYITKYQLAELFLDARRGAGDEDRATHYAHIEKDILEQKVENSFHKEVLRLAAGNGQNAKLLADVLRDAQKGAPYEASSTYYRTLERDVQEEIARHEKQALKTEENQFAEDQGLEGERDPDSNWENEFDGDFDNSR